jgi:hypothetical protein
MKITCKILQMWRLAKIEITIVFTLAIFGIYKKRNSESKTSAQNL